MPERWTGRLLGQMHNAGVSQGDIAEELKLSNAYVSMVFHSKRGLDRREDFENAFKAIVARRNEH